MKTKQIIHLAGLLVLLIVAGLIDFAYYHIGFHTEITLSRQFVNFLVDFQSLIFVIFYTAFFVVGAYLISEEDPGRPQTWVVFVVGLAIVFLIGTLPYLGIGIFRFLRDQIILFNNAPIRLTFHYGAILTALGLYRLGRGFIQKKQK